jgi:uncharacterized paraquat-inducible protein A
MTFHIACPACAYRNRFPGRLRETQATCYRCQAPFTISREWYYSVRGASSLSWWPVLRLILLVLACLVVLALVVGAAHWLVLYLWP